MRKDIIDLFEKGASLYRGNVFKTTEEQEEKQKETITDIDEFSKYIAEKETDINEELFKRYSGFQKPSDIFNSLIDKNINEELFKRYFGFQKPSDIFNSLINANDREKNNKLVDSIIGVLKNLKKEINEMSGKERKIEKPDKIVEIVREILKFNKQKQERQGIKILAPDQMLSRLPISLAQLQAGNNSEKLKNEIRQLLYPLYRSKNLTKQVYNNLIKSI